MPGGINPADIDCIVHGFGPGTPSTSTTDIISLKDVRACEIVIIGLNASTVTGSAVTLNQCKTVAGANSKALAFSTYYANVDPVNSAVFTNSTATSNTFTTATTNSAKLVYRIPIDPASLDTNNGFDCLQVALATGVNTTTTCIFHLLPKYGGNSAKMPDVVFD